MKTPDLLQAELLTKDAILVRAAAPESPFCDAQLKTLSDYLHGYVAIHEQPEVGLSPAARVMAAEIIDDLALQGAIEPSQANSFLGRIGMTLPDGQEPLPLGQNYIVPQTDRIFFAA